MALRVTASDLDKEAGEARLILRRAGLPEALTAVDAGSFGTTPLNLTALDAVSQAVAAALSLSRLPEAQDLPGTCLGLALAEEAADRLGALVEVREPPEGAGLSLKDYQDIAKKDSGGVLTALAKDAAAFVRFYGAHPDGRRRVTRDSEAVCALASYFRLAARLLRRFGGDRLEAETTRLKFSGGACSRISAEEPSQLLPVSFDDIVGNAEFVAAGTRLCRDVAGFDLKAGRNPKKVRNQILFVLGTPGCGKTVTAHAIGNYFLGLCQKSGIPARLRVIRRTDWASSYQNASASRLLEIFREEVFDFGGVSGVYWPDIDTAFAARGDSDIRQEEKANLGTIFGILDGTIGPRNGKWFMVCDANTLHMDEATISRISQAPIRALGPTAPEDFVKLLRDVKLRGKGPWLTLTEEEWGGIGRLCVEGKLSGRSVDNLSGRILTAIEDFDEPDEYFTLPLEEKEKLIAELSRKVDAARIKDLIDKHSRFEDEAQRRSEEERFQSRVREIRFHLSAQRAALTPSP